MSTSAVIETNKQPRKVEYKKTIFGYTPKWTVFSNLHPISRFSFLFFFNVPFVLLNPFINVCFLFIVIAFYLIAGVPKQYTSKFLPFGITLSVFLILTYTFFKAAFYNQEYIYPLFKIGGWTYYYENMVISFVVWVRWMAAIFGALFVFAVTDEKDINIALKTVNTPFFLRLAIATGLRSFFSFYYDAMQIIEAQKARGLDLDNASMVKKLRYYVAVMVPLIMIEMKRADEMSDAADSRGYVPFSKEAIVRTEYVGRDLHMKGLDYFVTFGSIGLLIFMVIFTFIPVTKAIVNWMPIVPFF